MKIATQLQGSEKTIERALEMRTKFVPKAEKFLAEKLDADIGDGPVIAKLEAIVASDSADFWAFNGTVGNIIAGLSDMWEILN